MKTELLYIVRGIKKAGIGLLDKRYYIFALWILVWFVPATLRKLDVIKFVRKIPKGKLLVMAQASGIHLERILPIWSWELNRQWAELGVFMPLGLAVSSFLIVTLLVQYIREAKKADREWHRHRT